MKASPKVGRFQASTFAVLLMLFASVCMSSNAVAQKRSSRDFYQLTVYHFANATQEGMLDRYLQKALLPALHEGGTLNIGVFKPIGNDTASDKLIYVVMPLSSLRQLAKLTAMLDKNSTYQSNAAEYLNAPYTAPPYQRMEVILLKAFSMAPQMQLPQLKGPREERVYELRSYESATEKIFRNKVHMFNEGDEIGLFKKLNFNAVFYSEVVSGSRMPNLMYMTSFENKADRDAHWKAFGESPEWKKLSSMPEYQHNVSHIDIYFLRPTAYSDY
jgi:hypothetical protein